MRPVRDASDGSRTGSPPSAKTIHSGTLSQVEAGLARCPRARSHSSLARLAWLDQGRPVAPAKAAANPADSAATCPISLSPRWSNQAITGAAGRPAAPSSTPLSARPVTPMLRTRTGPHAACASRTVRPIRSVATLTSRYGSISVWPPRPVLHGVGCSAYGVPRCDADRATALDEVVPMSMPITASVRGVTGAAPRSRAR